MPYTVFIFAFIHTFSKQPYFIRFIKTDAPSLMFASNKIYGVEP